MFAAEITRFSTFVGLQVGVSGQAGHAHTGHLLGLDPVGSSVFLLTAENKIELVPRVDLDTLKVLDETRNRNEELVNAVLAKLSSVEEEADLSATDCEQQRLKVVDWLKKNRLSVTVTGEQKVLNVEQGLVTIKPPYRPEDCQAANTIVLDRVSSILAQMPTQTD